MIDWTKPIQTRDGREAGMPVKCGNNYCVAVKEETGLSIYDLYENGRMDGDGEGPDDIINVPERVKVTGFLVVDGYSETYAYNSKHEIWDAWNKSSIQAIIDLEELLPDGVEVGHGL